MPKPTDIKVKIANLLSLASSPEPEEAKAALLKARELMAKHKLTPEECREHGAESVRREVLPITCTAMTNSWAVALAVVIARHYCCEAFRSKVKKKKLVSVGLTGLEDDFQVCRSVILCAHEHVMAYCRYDIRRKPGEPAKVYREKCNAYGWGFVSGLNAAFKQQDAEHQEWGLVLAVPQIVHDQFKDAKYEAWGKSPDGHTEYKRRGFQDGSRYSPDRKALSRPELD